MVGRSPSLRAPAAHGVSNVSKHDHFDEFRMLSYYLLDTPCAAGARSTGRLNKYWFIRGQFGSVTPPTSVRNNVIFAPFTKGKSHRPLFATFFQKSHFFSSKKGSRNRPVPVANSFNGHPVFGSRKINGSNYRKDLQWSTLQMPLAKMNYFVKDGRTDGRTSVFHVVPDG